MKRIDITGIIGWEFSSEDLRRLLGSGNEDVLINVYSPGGDAWEGLEMYNILKDYKGSITVRLGAIVASAATIFPLAADRVIARTTTIALIHKTWTCICGNADQLKKWAAWLDGHDSIMSELYAAKTGKKKNQILSDMAEDKWLFGGQTIVDYGLADETTDDISDLPEAENDKDRDDAEKIIIEIQSRLREKEYTDEQIQKIASMVKPQKKGIFSKFKKEPSTSDLDAIAAKLDQALQPDNAQAQDTPVVDGEHKPQEGKMDLSTILTQNPEAKAEHESLIAQARAEGEKAAEEKAKKEAVSSAAKNTLDILDAMGVVMNDDVRSAIENQTDARDFALDVLKKNGKAPASNAKDIGGADPAKEPQASAKEGKHYEGSKVGLEALYKKKEDK